MKFAKYKHIISTVVLLSIYLLLVIGLAGCKSDDDDGLEMTESETKSIITPILDIKIEKRKNLIFCGSFQLAWNELNKEIKPGNIKLAGNPAIVNYLNKGHFKETNISDQNYIAVAGKATQENLDKLSKRLKKFDDSVKKPNIIVDPNSYFAYSYLTKQLSFKKEFEADLDIKFKNNNKSSFVKGFGISSFNSDNFKDITRSHQVSILNYKNDNDFVIKLISEDNDDELILAKIEPESTLLKTIKAVQKRIHNQKSSVLEENEILKIPVIDLDINKQYNELLNKHFSNIFFQDYYLNNALQTIKFRLDEKGASLISTVILRTDFGIEIEEGKQKKPRKFIFDKPFLLLLKEKEAEFPYYATWFGNDELFNVLSTENLSLLYTKKDPNIGSIDMIFEELRERNDNLFFPYKIDKKWGYKDEVDKVVIKPEYDSLFCFQEGLALVMKNNKWGFINKKGDLIIDYQFNEGSSFSSGLAAVKIDNSWGYINKMGEVIIKPKYALALPFYNNIARVLDDEWLFIDKSGRIKYNLGVRFYSRETYHDIVIIFIQTGTEMDSNWNKMPIGYHLVININDEENMFRKFDNLITYDSMVLVRNDGNSGALDKDLNIIVPYDYKGLVGSDSHILAAKKDSLWGLIDINNQQIIDYKYSDAKIVNGIPCLKKDNKWNIFTPFNKMKLLFEVDELQAFKSNHMGTNYIEIKGEKILESEFSFAFKIIASAPRAISSERQKLIEEISLFDKMTNDIQKFEDTFVWYKSDKKMGLINTKTDIITEPIYDNIRPIDFGFAKIWQNSKVGLVNNSGEIILKPVCNSITDFEWYGSCKYSKFNIDGLFGLLDYQGNVFIEAKYDEIKDIGDGKTVLSLNGEVRELEFDELMNIAKSK